MNVKIVPKNRISGQFHELLDILAEDFLEDAEIYINGTAYNSEMLSRLIQTMPDKEADVVSVEVVIY